MVLSRLRVGLDWFSHESISVSVIPDQLNRDIKIVNRQTNSKS